MTQIDDRQDVTTATFTNRQWRRYPAYHDSGIAWLGQVPAHWDVKRLKYASLTQNEKLSQRPSGSIYIGLEQIESKTGRLLLDSLIEIVESSVSVFESGDILFGKLRPYLAKVARPNFSGVCTSEILVLRPTESVYNQFLFYRLLSGNFIDLINSMTYGTKMPRAGSEQINNISISLPPLAEQRAIAAFLDRETAQIDALVAAKERMIALLREKRSALISHVVTRGLDTDAPLRDSGVSWLGQVPAHWEILSLRRVIRKFVDYRGATPEKKHEGIPLITARNIKAGIIDFNLSQEFIQEEDYPIWMVRGFPTKGDILLTMEAPLGEVAQITEERIALAQRLILLKSDKSQINDSHLKYFFLSSSGLGELWSRATGSTAIGIKASHLKEISVIVPPLSEQQAIVNYLDSEIRKINSLIPPIMVGIERLREYRAALITAAVTGEIDVRDEGRGPTP